MPAVSIQAFITQATKVLSEAGVGTARLDCLVLLEDVTGINRASLLAHPEDLLSSALLAKLNTFITQRGQHEPLAYIRGKATFYGRDFIINKDVLVPRPESESIIDLLLGLPKSALKNVADLGTGSGCLGITAILELPRLEVDLVDISEPALVVATLNSELYDVPTHIIQNDFKDQVSAKQYDVLLANLPYVPDNFPINKAAGHEPSIALFAGQDGLDDYRHLFTILAQSHQPAKYVVTESLLSQHQAVTRLAKNAGYTLGQAQGLAQLFILS